MDDYFNEMENYINCDSLKAAHLATTLGAALEVTVIKQNVNVAQNVAKINCSKAIFLEQTTHKCSPIGDISPNMVG